MTTSNPYRITEDEIKRRVLLHDVDDEARATMAQVRKGYYDLMMVLKDQLPTSPETTVAFRRLDESLRDSIAAIARNKPNLEDSYARFAAETSTTE